jgi:hypothetical protein
MLNFLAEKLKINPFLIYRKQMSSDIFPINDRWWHATKDWENNENPVWILYESTFYPHPPAPAGSDLVVSEQFGADAGAGLSVLSQLFMLCRPSVAAIAVGLCLVADLAAAGALSPFSSGGDRPVARTLP